MASYQRIIERQASLASSNHTPVHTLAVNLPSNNSHLNIYESPVTEASLNWASLANLGSVPNQAPVPCPATGPTPQCPPPPPPPPSFSQTSESNNHSSMSTIPSRNRASLQDPVTGENIAFTNNEPTTNSPLHRISSRIPAPTLPNPFVGENVSFTNQDPINTLPMRTTIPARIRASLQNPLTGETIAFTNNPPESCRLEAPLPLPAQHVLNSGTVPANSNLPQVLPINNHEIVDLSDNVQSEVVVNTSPDGSHSHIHHHVHQHHYHHSHPNRLHYFGVPHQLQITISPQMVIF